MTFTDRPVWKFFLAGLIVLGLVGMAVAIPFVHQWVKPNDKGQSTTIETEAADRVQRFKGDVLVVPPAVRKSLGVETSPVQTASRPRMLPPFAGSLALDPHTKIHKKALFPGEVVELGAPKVGERRHLQVGDVVEPGQLLAVVWNKDLGEKKSELVEAVCQFHLDERNFERLKQAGDAIPQPRLEEARHQMTKSRIALTRARSTLAAWRLTSAEIASLEAEADRLLTGKPLPADAQKQREWVRVEIRSTIRGTILEMNVNIGDVVDTATDLFKIYDLSRLSVWAHVYEEDLPALRELATPIKWMVQLKADPRRPPIEGVIERISPILDPAQHTALVIGSIQNPGDLIPGQFISATVELPLPRNELEIPTHALVEDGEKSIVFVQAGADNRFRACQVTVARRYHDLVFVRIEPDGLRAGHVVVTKGAVELRAALDLTPVQMAAE